MVLAVLALAACAGEPQTRTETVEVKVPIAVARKAPSWLLSPVKTEIPTFVAKTDPAASSALTPEGERKFRLLIHDLKGRISQWEAWAQTP